MSVVPAKRRALAVLPEAPYPVIGGGPLRSASILEFLASEFELHAIHFRLIGDPDPAGQYPAGMLHAAHTIDLPHHTKDFWPRLRRNLGRGLRGVPPLVDRFAGFDHHLAKILQGQHFDLAWIEHFWAAQYVSTLQPHAAKLVLDLHNVESAYFDSMKADSPLVQRPLIGHFARCARALEASLLPRFDWIVTSSEADRCRIVKNAKASAVVANTIPWHERPKQPGSNSIVFSGNFAYQPNQSALAWFLASCWPAIRQAHPGCTLRLVGKEIQYAKQIGQSAAGIDFVGPVSDAIEEIAKSRLAIVPLLSGSGTRLKILEAWAAGTPVVSTTLGAEGLEAIPGQHLRISDSATAFRQSVIELFDDRELGSHLAQAARLLYEEHYTWQSARAQLKELEL
ncbi:glycosyltransferase family 4 protein [Bryobacter aggregatus]|uniref:glycosyltransferase family 4 protein n=1 Tax=Bryobacter aggregatus TaxID=360054 RepID=UPI0004E28D9D|nr:glycosyltransferase family 4 protein [Bryobacter aggregatus]